MSANMDRVGEEPMADWREQHLAELIGDGYKIEAVMAAPTNMPVVTGRFAKVVGGRYDYKSTLRFEPTEQEREETEAYTAKMDELVTLHGAEEVKIAFPGPTMIAEHPEYAGQAHHVLMVPATA